MDGISVINERNGRQVCGDIACAHTAVTRFFGLLGHDRLLPGEGLWIKPSSGVHTLGMKFSIDVVGLDEGLRVVKIWHQMRPRRATGIHRRVKSVLELASGELVRLDVRLGDQLRVETEPQRNV